MPLAWRRGAAERSTASGSPSHARAAAFAHGTQPAGDRGCLSARIVLQSEDRGVHRRGDAGYLNQHRINLVVVFHS
jgi:hypothetical protein